MKLPNYILIVGLVLLLMVGMVNGAVLTTSQFGAISNPTGDPLGGGKGYSDIKTSGDCTATSTSELTACLASATSGNVVFIPSTANINMTGISGTLIPAGVILASDRGYNGNAGGRIFRNLDTVVDTGINSESMFVAGGDNVRVTGLRIEGPTKDAVSLALYRIGIALVNRQGSVVDNCEVSGWSAGISVFEWDNPSLVTAGLGTSGIGSSIANIHHNYIHHNQETGTGYGIQVSGSQVLVKGNVFDYNRHSVASGGLLGEGYEASYNLDIGHTWDTPFDVHGSCSGINIIAGNLYRIHHNTKYGSLGISTQIRGKPVQSASIYLNSFNNCTTNCYHDYDVPEPSIIQADSIGNMTSFNNLVDNLFSANTSVNYITPGWISC